MAEANIAGIVEEIGRVYSGLVVQHGVDPKAGGYRDEVSRNLRYDKLAQILAADGAPERFTVNELGCGYGAFYEYLESAFPGRVAHYTGYDVSDEMLNRGRNHLKLRPATMLKQSTVTEEADYTFISGIFNVRLSASNDEWLDYIHETLRQSYRMSKRGMAFYILTSYVDRTNERFFYANPSELLSFCQSQLSRHVLLAHDYPLYEFTTIVMRR